MELNQVLAQIDSLKKEAETLLPAKPEFERAFWEKFRLEFNYNSNHMEGNTLTYGQTKLLLLFDRTTGDNKGREIEEMKAHDVALKMIIEISSDTESRLTEKLIREINELILVRPFYNDAMTPEGKPTKRLITPGEYKKHPNSVLLPDGNMFYYASPEETPALMGDLIAWYHQNKDIIHPVRLAALMHYKLVRIHPFDDSNGRTTRLVMNFILMQNGYAPLVIESKKKENYLTALNKADVGNLDAFEEYIAGVSVRWQEIFLKAIRGEKVEDPEDFEKEVELFKKQIQTKNDKRNTSPYNILVNSFLPLIVKAEARLSVMDDFFLAKNVSKFTIDDSGTYEIEKVLNNFSKEIPLKNKFLFSYQHMELKTKSILKNYVNDIELRFTNDTYKISLYPSGRTIEKVNRHVLSGNEIDEIADFISKEEFGFIKSNS